MNMTVTKLRKILEILEKHGFGEYIPCIYEGGCIEIGTPSVTTQTECENIIYLDGFEGYKGSYHSEELDAVFKEMEETL